MPKPRYKRKRDATSYGNKAVSYARVSSKEQEKEGYSIPAQQKLIQGYAQANGLQIVGEYVDVETAKQSGRTNFEAMVRYLKAHPQVRTILVEKTDRLYRNLKDWVRLDELDVAIHLVKEGAVLSDESRSSEKFMHGIKVLMAKNYIDNLSEEVRKGQMEKASQGFWPNRAPIGYENVVGPDGKKRLAIHPVEGPIIANIFNWYASGNLSLKDVAEMARKAGLIFRRAGGPIPAATIHRLLRHRIYTGHFEWNGRVYKGQHPALTTRELWDRVQGVLDGRNAAKVKKGSKHNFAFAGLIKCGHCGCALVGDIKKGRYIYYRCSGYKGKCGEPYVREEVFVERFQAILEGLTFDKDILEWLSTALRQNHDEQRQEHEAAIQRLRAEIDRIEQRMHAMYLDKLDGRIQAVFYDRMADQFRLQQEKLYADMVRHGEADCDYVQDGIKLLELAQSAGTLFRQETRYEQRRTLDYVLSNSTWKSDELSVTFRQPFDMIAKTNAIIASKGAPPDGNLPGHNEWRREWDSNPR